MAQRTRTPDVDALEVVADTYTEPYWAAAREHRLVAMQCGSCGHFRMPPTPFCPQCHSQETKWPELRGQGAIYSFTLLPPRKGQDEGPLAVALVEFAEAPGVRFLSSVVDADPAAIVIGAPVRVVWQDREDGQAFLRFALDSA